MNRTELIKQISRIAGTPIKQTKPIVNTMLDVISTQVEEGKEVNVREFGRFYPKLYKGRTLKNLQGESVKVPEHYTMGFKPSYKVNERLK